MTKKIYSEIFRDVAQVFFAAAVINPLLTYKTGVDWLMVRFGMGMSLAFWMLSVKIVKKGKL